MRTVRAPRRPAGRRLRTPALAAAGIVAAGMLLAPSTASAAAPVTHTSEGLNVTCTGSTSTGGVELALDQNGPETDGFVTVFDDSGTAISLSPERAGTVVRDGGTLTGSFPLVDPDTGAPEGEATFAVEVTPTGVATTETERAQIGNVRQEFTVTYQDVVGAGRVDLSEAGETALVDCIGRLRRTVTTTTLPDATTGSGELLNVLCDVPIGEGRSVGVYVEGGDVTLVALRVGSEEDSISGESMNASVTRSDVSATVPLSDMHGEPAGEGAVTLEIRVIDRTHTRQLHSVGTRFITTELLRATGSAVLPGGQEVGLDCDGLRTSYHEVATSPSGPKETGPAPANDRPEGAIELTPGDRSSTHTRAAAESPEEPLWCYSEPPEDPGFLPGRTVWYRFTGTGGPVTVDTAGSLFNTTLAVYEVDGSALAQVACADDHMGETWQAYATVQTEAGTGYLVQVGGIGGQSGLLKVALR